MAFVHLHTHSHFSLLDALGSPYSLIGRAKELGMKAISITDNGVMYGVVDFYQAALGSNIKPIVGAEVYVALRSRFDRADEEKNPHQLVLLAYNDQGYHNLMILVTKGQLEGLYEKPMIDWELLNEFHEGLIALSGDHTGEVGKLLAANNIKEAKKVAEKYQELFGKNNYYLEITRHGLEIEDEINPKLIKLSKDLDIPLVATNNSRYPSLSDKDAHDALICVRNQKLISDQNRPKYAGDYSILSEEQMRELFKDIPEACDITVEIAERCNVKIPLGQNLIPAFQCPPGLTPADYLRELCIEGCKKRYGDPLSEKILKQLDYELGVINKTGFPTYFLIVWDFINWAKNQGIAVGPGRGSAAGAIVTYALAITDIDPLEYDLVFERFLNPERVSPPDIDIDFADDSREKVINYVVEKYSRESVAQIITFGTMGAKAAIRDVGRVLGFGYKDVDILAKLIPNRPGTKLKEALEKEPLIKESLEKNPAHKQIWDLATKLEGVVRHASTHASAVVIAGEPIVNHAPLQKSTAGKDDSGIVTQYSMKPLEVLGLLKMDFLGLRNLTVLANTAKIIRENYQVDLDWQNLATDDKPSYELLSEGKTTGVFQLESEGMKHYLKELKPSNFEDIIAMISLYRPGPLEAIPDFIAAKNGLKEVTYLDPELEPILKKTYGVIVYQEQVLEIARQFCGFSYGEADILRRAVGKKIKELLLEQKNKFIEKAVARGKSKEIAEKIWDFIEPFARYGFNKSHAACYAMIAYQTAYLKSHFPAAFMAALMTSDRGDTDRIVIEIEESKLLGLTILPPSINESNVEFTVVGKDAVRFGLGAIKNLGDTTSYAIVEARKTGGPFTSLSDFFHRMPLDLLNRKSLEALSKANVFEDLVSVSTLMENIDTCIQYISILKKLREAPVDSLFANVDELNKAPTLKLKEAEPLPIRQILDFEKEALGLYLSAHPLEHLKDFFAKTGTRIDKITLQQEGKKAKIAGMIIDVKRILTKTNQAMSFLVLENPFGRIECVIFPKAMEACQEYCVPDTIVTASGTISFRDRRGTGQSDTPKLLIDTITPLEIPQNLQKKTEEEKPYTISIPATTSDKELVILKEILTRFPGTSPVQLELTKPLHKATIINLTYRVNPDKQLEKAIQKFHETLTKKA